MLHFSGFSVDLHRRRLTRDGTRVVLSARLVDVLGHLASHPGKVFPKEALLDRFWPGLHVAENSTEHAITRIRKALGDNAAMQKYIQTVAGQGYRFVGTVDDNGASPAAEMFDGWTHGRVALE